MASDIISSSGSTAGVVPGFHSQGASATPTQTNVSPQALKKVELAPTPTSNVQYDRSAMEKSLKEAVKLLNDQMSSQSQGLGFSYDDSKNSPVVTVRNLESGHVVRQIPSVDLLNLAHKLDDLKGILYNAHA